MKQLTCEMCGSTGLVKQDGIFVCQSCGTQYSVEEAKKMMVEGTVEVQGTVKVDNSAFVEKYLFNARRALNKEDWEEVEKYYNMVERDSPNNMEAVFFSSYGKAMLSLTDSDYFKREQKFQVLVNSMSVISDYFEETTENKEEVLRRISDYIIKMYSVNFVYQVQSADLSGALNALSGVRGSKKWCMALLDAVKRAFLIELKQISEKHNDSYIQELINQNNVVTQQVKEKTKTTAEAKMRFCGIMGLTPYTFIVGIFALCFVGKAKEENGGCLSKKAERYLTMGVTGFSIWILLFIIVFVSL